MAVEAANCQIYLCCFLRQNTPVSACVLTHLSFRARKKLQESPKEAIKNILLSERDTHFQKLTLKFFPVNRIIGELQIAPDM